MTRDKLIEVKLSAKPIEKAKAAEADLKVEDPPDGEEILKNATKQTAKP